MKKEYVLIHVRHPWYSSDDVLLVMKDRPDWQRGFFNLVGGKIEQGESPEVAAVRELKEETGYTNSQEPWKMGIVEGDGEIVHCYTIFTDRGSLKPREGETEIVKWFPWNIVRDDKRLIPSLRIILPFIFSSVENWHIYVKDTFMDKENNTISVTIPSHLDSRFYENPVVTKILEA